MKLELFKKDTCPYCRRVFKVIEESGRNDVEMLDIVQDPAALERLVNVGGMNQVPCLFIDGEPLYESLDIIEWLEAHPENASE